MLQPAGNAQARRSWPQAARAAARLWSVKRSLRTAPRWSLPPQQLTAVHRRRSRKRPTSAQQRHIAFMRSDWPQLTSLRRRRWSRTKPINSSMCCRWLGVNLRWGGAGGWWVGGVQVPSANCSTGHDEKAAAAPHSSPLPPSELPPPPPAQTAPSGLGGVGALQEELQPIQAVAQHLPTSGNMRVKM